MAEKAINFKIDEELYKKVKIKTIEKGITLKDYVLTLIKNDLENKK